MKGMESPAQVIICVCVLTTLRLRPAEGKLSMTSSVTLRHLDVFYFTVYLTCLTCAGYSVLLFALPYGDGHIVNGDIPLVTRASNSFKHNLFREETKRDMDAG